MAATDQDLFWVKSGITNPELSDAAFNKWYDYVHVPDILKTSGIKSAYRYKNLDPSAKQPYLALYPTQDVRFFETEEFTSIPVHDDCFPGPKKLCFEDVEFNTRCYTKAHSYEKPGAKPGPANLVISAALTPASGTDADFHAWYKDEHYAMLAACPAYVRTRRYRLSKVRSGAECPTYLALHEFEGESLPEADLAKTAETEWARRVMGSLTCSEVGAYRLLRGFGDVDAKF